MLKFPGNSCMDDLQFYILFNSISVTEYVRVIMMELFLGLERFPPSRRWGGGPNQGWIICHFTSFSTVFRSYQDDEGMMTKGSGQWNTVYGYEDST